MKLWTDGEWVEQGTTRWVVRWWVDETGDPEPDLDLLTECTADFGTRAAAVKAARRKAGGSFHGCAEVVQQRVQQWEDAPDPDLGEWVDVGFPEEGA